MSKFQDFLTETNRILERYKISRNDVAYINLSENYWINFDEFFALKEPPKIWETFKKNYIGTWDVPSEFKIVMRDYSWIEYYVNWGDEYYSTFVLHKPPTKAPKRFFVQKTPTKITIGDYIALKLKSQDTCS